MDTMLDELFTTRCDEAVKDSKESPFDCIIVGGGTCGLVFASVLGNAGLRVVLLEAGPLVLLDHVNNSALRFSAELGRGLQRKLEYSPLNSQGVPFGRFVSCLGGRGMFWNGASPRFHSSDFHDWPLKLEDLNPFYQRAESAFGVSTDFGDSGLAQFICRSLRHEGYEARLGPMAVDTQSNRNGILGGDIGNGLSILMKERTWSQAQNTISVVPDCLVQSIILNGGRTHAEGVAITDRRTGQSFELVGRSVVLAAGAFSSVRLAQLSGIRDSSGVLGRYLSEHIFCRGNFPVPASHFGDRAEAAVVWIPGAGITDHQLEIHVPGNRLFRIRNAQDWDPRGALPYTAMIRSFGSVRAKPESQIVSSSGSAIEGFTVNMVYDEQDEQLKARMIASIKTVAGKLGLSDAPVEALPSGSSYHECGGLRMGNGPADGVCDRWGTFFSVDNLLSGDAACFPSISCANPHLTLAAMAYLKADHLVERIQRTIS